MWKRGNIVCALPAVADRAPTHSGPAPQSTMNERLARLERAVHSHAGPDNGGPSSKALQKVFFNESIHTPSSGNQQPPPLHGGA